MTARQKIEKVKSTLVLDHPFWATLLLRMLEIVEAKEYLEQRSAIMGFPPTMATDGKKIYYHPDFVDKCSLAETLGVIVHEICHPMLLHHLRRGDRDPRKWNYCADFPVNKIVRDSHFTLPKGGLEDAKFGAMYVEEIYALLKDEPQGGGRSIGEVMDAGGKGDTQTSSSEIAREEEEWRMVISQAAQVARQRGDMPAGLDRLVGELLEPVIDWRDILQRWVSNLAKNDYRWFPPNRRYLYRGLYLPSLRSETLPPIGILWDCSGSIGGSEMDRTASEVSAILEQYHTNAYVIYHDTEVAAVEEFTQDDLPLRFHPKGGGGTDFRCVFEYIEKNSLDICGLIAFTDMCGTFPAEAPDYPVIWVQMGGYGQAAPFGEVVKVRGK